MHKCSRKYESHSWHRVSSTAALACTNRIPRLCQFLALSTLSETSPCVPIHEDKLLELILSSSSFYFRVLFSRHLLFSCAAKTVQSLQWLPLIHRRTAEGRDSSITAAWHVSAQSNGDVQRSTLAEADSQEHPLVTFVITVIHSA